MSISSVNVVVPASGDGPIADVSTLVGKKTVELSGTFIGSYVLLGSQNNVTFVPVANFDSDGCESIKVTIEIALRSVRVRSSASNPSGVTMNISGVVGINQFTTLASFVLGTSGYSTVVDLNTVFPPSGVEQDVAFICDGRFKGLLAVEGSMDGLNFNPIGDGFRADSSSPSLLNSSSLLEFSPMSTKTLVRYLRVHLNTPALAPVTVTLGGSNPPTPGGTGANLIQVSETEARSVNSLVEAIIYEWEVNLSDLPPGGLIKVQVNAIARISPGAFKSEYNVYLGATDPGNTAGGILYNNFTVIAGTDRSLSLDGVLFVNPGGKCLVQVAGKMVTPTGPYILGIGYIRGITIDIG